MSQHCIGRNLVYSNAKNYQSLLVTVLHSNLKDDSLCQYCTWYTFIVIEELSLIIVIIVQVSAIWFIQLCTTEASTNISAQPGNV